jgi:hypothetical protein
MLRLRFLPTTWTLILPLLCLFSAAVFAVGAVGLSNWIMGAVSLGMLGFSFALLRTRRRLAAAARAPEEETPNPTHEAARLPAVLHATEAEGLRHREGFLVLADGFAAFVPTQEWSHLAASVALGLIATRLPLSRPELAAGRQGVEGDPPLREELDRLVRERDGFWLSDAWTWTPFLGASVLLALGDHTLTVQDAPQELVARWRPAEATPDKARTVRRLILVLSGLGGGLILLGGLAWHLTGNLAFLIAGTFWGLVFLGSLVAGLILSRQAMAARRGTDSGAGPAESRTGDHPSPGSLGACPGGPHTPA